jgi:hypothetical protein
MTESQKRKRQALEQRFGKPDPRATEKEVEHLLRLVSSRPTTLSLHTDEHAAYPRAIRKLTGYSIEHHATSSRRARTPQNPLHCINLADLLIRHGGSNHKRETIAFSKRRQAAAERMAVFQVWRNFMKTRSEQRPSRSCTPAMLLGLENRPLTLEDILHRRRFPTLVPLPDRLARYYWRQVPTRQVPNGRTHALKYAA